LLAEFYPQEKEFLFRKVGRKYYIPPPEPISVRISDASFSAFGFLTGMTFPEHSSRVILSRQEI